MYHSIIFYDGKNTAKNTYTDWKLVPASRPVVLMPDVKTNIVDIPGANGSIDLSELLTGYPVYSNRSGQFQFHVLNDYKPWHERYQEIAEYVHGKQLSVTLEDDPDYFYIGRVSIGEWTSNNDGTWSDISFNYTLEPYKIYKDSQIFVKDSDTTAKTFNFNSSTNKNALGRMPVVPVFTVENISSGSVTIRANNNELGIVNVTKTVNLDGVYKFSDIILSKIKNNNNNSIYINGAAKVTFEFDKGDL